MVMPAHQPDERSRNVVETASGYGLPQPMICALIGVGSVHTLLTHYREELDRGKARAAFQVAKTLFDRATSGKDLGAAIFYLKSQAGFREKHVLDDNPDAKAGLIDLINQSMALPPIDVTPTTRLPPPANEDAA
jgi:hypothetical protein